MRPALNEQCLVRGAANLVPLAAATERKRVPLDFSCFFAQKPSGKSQNKFFYSMVLRGIQQMLKITVRKNIIFNSCLKSKSFSYAIIVAY